MITQKDITLLKTIFVTKEEFKNELAKYATKEDLFQMKESLENLIISQIKDVIDMIGEVIESNKRISAEVRILTTVVRDHEIRLRYFEDKTE